MNETPSSERTHIGIFGRRNSGKSSLINAITGQDAAIVSEEKGTTTDPVSKSMELLPLGPVVIIDTPGTDDEGKLGQMRVSRAMRTLEKCDIALYVADASVGITAEDEKMIARIKEKNIPRVIVMNKADLKTDCDAQRSSGEGKKDPIVYVSAKTGENIGLLKETISSLINTDKEKRLIGDLLKPDDTVVLVIPIDKAAPKGRIILPQQQVLRDILDAGAVAAVTRDGELAATLKNLRVKPQIVVTDSQVFEKVAKIVPEDIALTSFSILMSRYKGNLKSQAHAAAALDRLKDGDRVLIAEGCTHHRQCDDIGTVKLPAWIKNYTGKRIAFDFTGGSGFADDLKSYRLIVHCGGCMLNDREMSYRLRKAEEEGVPMTNYGMAIAKMKGILERSLAPFGF